MAKNLSKKALELKECLDTIRAKKRLLGALQRQLAQYQHDCELNGIDYSKPSFKTSDNISSEERYIMRLEEYRARINNVMQEIFDIEDKIATEIAVLNDYEQAMIIDRYIHNWSWKRICKEYNYCYTETGNSAQRIVYNALKKI